MHPDPNFSQISSRTCLMFDKRMQLLFTSMLLLDLANAYNYFSQACRKHHAVIVQVIKRVKSAKAIDYKLNYCVDNYKIYTHSYALMSFSFIMCAVLTAFSKSGFKHQATSRFQA